MPRVARADLLASSLQVAPLLLGARLVHDDGTAVVVVRITEVEAYAGRSDPASHAYRGRTPRTEVMFGAAGYLYVYFSYGMHWCVNVVCGAPGEACAVLLRAGQVVEGLEAARSRRPTARDDAELARGPARLTNALALGRVHNGLDICAPDARVWLEPATAAPADRVRSGPRVGVAGPGADVRAFPWRFWLAGEPTVSVYRPGKPRRRPVDPGGRLSATRSAGLAGRDERTATP